MQITNQIISIMTLRATRMDQITYDLISKYSYSLGPYLLVGNNLS